MTKFYEDDLAGIFDVNEFAVSAIFPNGEVVNGILDENPVIINNVEQMALTFTCPSDKVKTPTAEFVTHGAIITATIDGTPYSVIGIQDQGDGTTNLILSKDI